MRVYLNVLGNIISTLLYISRESPSLIRFYNIFVIYFLLIYVIMLLLILRPGRYAADNLLSKWFGYAIYKHSSPCSIASIFLSCCFPQTHFLNVLFLISTFCLNLGYTVIPVIHASHYNTSFHSGCVPSNKGTSFHLQDS